MAKQKIVGRGVDTLVLNVCYVDDAVRRSSKNLC